jgi:hypothetical protein
MMDIRSSDDYFCVNVKMIGRNRKLVHGSFSQEGVWTRREGGGWKTFWKAPVYIAVRFLEKLIPQLK